MDEQQFCSDLSKLTAIILKDDWPHPESRLGDVIAHMAKNNLLLKRKRDEYPEIRGAFSLSNEARDYLNALQTEKLTHCRLCYHKDNKNQCDFHKRYIFTKNVNEYRNEYVQFLNSEMGIISFVELYYTFLSIDLWKITAQILFRDLTGFSSVKELLDNYNYTTDENVDSANVETMDTDDD